MNRVCEKCGCWVRAESHDCHPSVLAEAFGYLLILSAIIGFVAWFVVKH